MINFVGEPLKRGFEVRKTPPKRLASMYQEVLEPCTQ
jgi:hypothetical protein